MKSKLEIACENNENGFVCEVIQAVLTCVNGVEEIHYSPQVKEFSSKFRVCMSDGVKYGVSIVKFDVQQQTET